MIDGLKIKFREKKKIKNETQTKVKKKSDGIYASYHQSAHNLA